MKLHRAGRRADWAGIPRRRWNGWQQLAGNTGGVVTAGNFFTLIGLTGVLAGLGLIANGRYGQGFVLLAAGRACDLLDGWLAERTGTKSPLGELADATADKLGTVAAVIVLVLTGLVPVLAALLVAVPNGIIAAVAFIAKRRGVRLQPSRPGKLSMAAAWVGLLMFVADKAWDMPLGSAWLMLAYAVAAASAALAAYAAAGYGRELKG